MHSFDLSIKCYGTVINAWSKADDRHETAEHAEKLLYRMEEMFLNKKSSNPREMLSNIAYNLGESVWLHLFCPSY